MKIVEHSELADYIEINLRDNHWPSEEITEQWNNEKHYDNKGIIFI